jgi:hypothetical protein
MLKKQYLTRLEKLYRKLAPRNQEGGILIGDVADPIRIRVVFISLLKNSMKNFLM